MKQRPYDERVVRIRVKHSSSNAAVELLADARLARKQADVRLVRIVAVKLVMPNTAPDTLNLHSAMRPERAVAATRLVLNASSTMVAFDAQEG